MTGIHKVYVKHKDKELVKARAVDIGKAKEMSGCSMQLHSVYVGEYAGTILCKSVCINNDKTY